MKTKINYPYSIILIVLISISSNGCYTHLAYIDHNLYSDAQPEQIATPEPIIIYVPVPMPMPSPVPEPPPPVYDPIHIPPSGSIPPTAEAPSNTTRNSGYQRSGSTSENNATDSRSDRRPSGSIRTGR